MARTRKVAEVYMDSLFAQLDAEAPLGVEATPASAAAPARRAAAPSSARRTAAYVATGGPNSAGGAHSAFTVPEATPLPGQRSAPITISALSTHILALFERDELLRDLWVVGEVSNWKKAASGHIYFSLKDAGGTIGAVMWRGSAASQRWFPQEGDLVHAHGSVSIYPERGQYQMYVNELQPVGRGQLYAAYEALKERLSVAGYFEAARKRPIPVRPQRIGIITSPGAAALRDMLRILSVRWPTVEVLLFPSLVQGGEAPGQVVAALANANRYSEMVAPLDVIVLARGGGSIEDLWCFNDEQVAHAVFHSRCPIVTGVGHETDFTIVDFVADLRAPTPSAAAVACVPDSVELRAQLQSLRASLAQDVTALLDDARAHFAQRRLRLQRLNPERMLRIDRQQVDERTRRLSRLAAQRLQRYADRTRMAHLRLDALNPQRVLERGYSIVQGEQGQVVIAPALAQAGELLRVRTAAGDYNARKEA
jgi:exodeoxyribonuclease VII large subunit